jgi:hypothetical protein
MICASHQIGVIRINLRNVEWAGHLAYMGKKRSAYKVLVKKTEGKRSLVRSRHRWEHNIKGDLKLDRRVENVDWVYLVQVRDHCDCVLVLTTHLWDSVESEVVGF